MKLLAPINYTLLYSNIAPSTYNDWNSATTYAVGNKVVYTDRREYEAKTANINMTPLENTADWLLIGAENKMKMFDQFVHTKTINNNSIEVIATALGLSGVYLGNIHGNNLIIEIRKNSDGTVLETLSQDMFMPLSGWNDYFININLFDEKISEFVYERVTTDIDINVRIVIDGDVCECGQLFFGKHRELGCTSWEPNITLIDYSKKSINTDTGETYLEKGKSVKKIDYSVLVPTSQAIFSYKWLNDNLGIPCVFFHSNEYEILSNYCYIEDVVITLKGVQETMIQIKTEGLI